jgi:hypothetical protein
MQNTRIFPEEINNSVSKIILEEEINKDLEDHTRKKVYEDTDIRVISLKP